MLPAGVTTKVVTITATFAVRGTRSITRIWVAKSGQYCVITRSRASTLVRVALFRLAWHVSHLNSVLECIADNHEESLQIFYWLKTTV